MTNEEASRYVVAAARTQEQALTTEQLQRVAAVFVRTAGIAALVMNLDLPESAEPMATFLP